MPERSTTRYGKALQRLHQVFSPLNLAAAAWLIATWAFAAFQLVSERDRLLHDAAERTQAQAQAFGAYSRSSILRLSEFLLDLRASWLVGQPGFIDMVRERENLVVDLSFQVSVIDKHGLLIYSSIAPPAPGQKVDLSGREHFRVHQNAGGRDMLFISDPVKGKVSRKWSIQFTRPILRAGSFDGVIVVSVSPEQFASFAQSFTNRDGEVASVIKTSGQVLARVPAMEGTLARAVSNRPYLASGSPQSGSYRAVSGSEGVERVFGYYRLPEFGLNFVVGESVGLVLAPYEVYRRVALAGAIASTLLLGLLYYSLRRSMGERQRHMEEMRLASLVYSSSSEAMVVTSLDGTIIDVNPAFAAATGYTAKEVKGRPGYIVSGAGNVAGLVERLRATVAAKGRWSGEFSIRRKDGSEFPAYLTVDTYLAHAYGERRRVALIHDMTEKRQAEEVIRHQANFDALTDLPNRRLFFDRLRQEIERSRGTQDVLALLFIDLDRFKEVNDTLGHDQGDLLLLEAARRIAASVRASDTVARLAGDEFTVILSAVGDAGVAGGIAEAILERIAAPYHLAGELVVVSASIGVATYPKDADNAEDLLVCADQAMFAAKEEGRNRWKVFTQALLHAERERLRITQDLRTALASGQFALHYQPIVNLRTGKVCKAEALIRWDHPARGPIHPADFIAVAEESGLIIDIGRWVLTEALDQLARWQVLLGNGFQISVNKSPVEFSAPASGPESWSSMIERRNVPVGSLVIEITEGSLMEQNADVMDQLSRFQAAGIEIALDDFGTGYSSLSYLRRLDIDYIKIDQSFVRSLTRGPDDVALCRAIISMAHALRIRVIAEGVETESQRDILVAAGCDYGQGHYFCPPVEASAFEAYVSAVT
ncbi:diguanylate cyclase/phosphodiesterase [Cupriavidus necator N-1]|uniref:Diguanylate cyclase/phosphodiesterase n=1 Tax=Cupriavidus necator (strain ATCC 43291 / DSM 13513 / CCUG 52238 / LMG 8453 / N-1) TaxID=1042878 RepID=G0ERW4_CUPNN|nr:EAL domain-containing protein [Cupriavidus necator]AEI75392.1 diguanylate cyclase/phosphodiesterase [Cupriavidus necator N-1]MDX6012463.1 EAL domain-containing protein [Cupriavidus necator]